MPGLLTTTRPLAFLLIPLMLVTLTGCETPFLKPFLTPAPIQTSQRDQNCVANCDLAKTQCQQRQRLREDECHQHAQQMGIEYAECVARPRRHCLEPEPCLGANMAICGTQHGECIQDCERPVPAATTESRHPN